MTPSVGYLFTLTDKQLALKISPLYPHSQHNSFALLPSLPFLSPSFLHSERKKEKDILRADDKLFNQVSSFLQTCDPEAQVNQLLVLVATALPSYFLLCPVSCTRP